jgi:lysophospholipase L1-like esterase
VAKVFQKAMALRRRMLFAVVAIVLVLLLLFLLFEIVSALVSPRLPEPKMGKNFKGLWRHELPPITPEADFLIVCAGDSHTEGAGAVLGFDYPSQLELQLNAVNPAKRYQVINLGVSGFNTSEAADRTIEFLRKTPRKPDFVIFSGGFNNAWNLKGASILPDEIRRKGNIAAWEYVLARSQTYKLSQVAGARLAALRRGESTGPTFVDVNADDAEFLRGWITHDLQRLYDASCRAGADLALLNYAYAGEKYQDWGDRAFGEFAKEFKLLMIDVHWFGLPEAEELATPSRWLAPDWHPNRYGYARIAFLIVQALQEGSARLFDKAGTP